MKIVLNTLVTRKRDGAVGRVVRVERLFTGSHPGHVFKNLYHIRLDDTTLRLAAGGDMVGDRSWLVSYFRILQAARSGRDRVGHRRVGSTTFWN